VSATAVVVVAAVLLMRPAHKSQTPYLGTRITSDAGLSAPMAKVEVEDALKAAPQRETDKKTGASGPTTRNVLVRKDESRDKLEAKQLAVPKPQLIAPREEVATIQGNASPLAHSNVAVMAKRARTDADAESGRSASAAGAAVSGVAGGVLRAAPAPAPSTPSAANQVSANLDQAQLQSQASQDAVGQVQTETSETQAESQSAQKKDALKLNKETAKTTASTSPLPGSQQSNRRAANAAPGAYGTGGGMALQGSGARSAVEVMGTPTSIPKAKLPTYRWTIDAGGNLQRSADGKSWEVVPIANGAKLHSLAVVERDIWTGGAAGLLYHSQDGGSRWERVRPAVGDRVLSDDVTRIALPSRQHVKLTTSSGDVWTSADGGQSWQKQ
jgi:hypothetical protein